MPEWRCPESISGHSADKDGRCYWCKRKIDSKMPKPDPIYGVRSELDLAYEYYYDPDWGGRRYDV